MKDPLSFWLKVVIACCGVSFIFAVLSMIDRMELRRELQASTERAKIGTALCAMVKHRLASDADELLKSRSSLRAVIAGDLGGDGVSNGASAISLCVPAFDMAKMVECRSQGDFACLADLCRAASVSISIGDR